MRPLFMLQSLFVAIILMAVLFNAGCATRSEPDGSTRIAVEF